MGGLICISLGNAKPTDFDDIVATLIDKFDKNLFFSLEVIDAPSRIYLGSCEAIDSRDNNLLIISQSRISNTEITIFTYTFDVVDKIYHRYITKKTL